MGVLIVATKGGEAEDCSLIIHHTIDDVLDRPLCLFKTDLPTLMGRLCQGADRSRQFSIAVLGVQFLPSLEVRASQFRCFADLQLPLFFQRNAADLPVGDFSPKVIEGVVRMIETDKERCKPTKIF